MQSKKAFLLSLEGKTYLKEAYSTPLSLHQIAEELGTSYQAVRRAMIAHNLPVRDKGEAQKVALATGRQAHPTKGRERSESERTSISNSLKKIRKVTCGQEENCG